MPAKTDSVRFTAEGQIVIPAWLRKQFHIRDGTTAVVQATPEGILLRPKTRWAVERGHGLLKCQRRPGEETFAEEWAGHKRGEMELEEDKKPAIQIPDSNAILTHFRSEPVPNSPENAMKPA